MTVFLCLIIILEVEIALLSSEYGIFIRVIGYFEMVQVGFSLSCVF